MTLYVIMEDACSTTVFLNASAIQGLKDHGVKRKKKIVAIPLYVIMEDAFSKTVFPNVSAIQVSKVPGVKLKKQVSSLENDKQNSSL